MLNSTVDSICDELKRTYDDKIAEGLQDDDGVRHYAMDLSVLTILGLSIHRSFACIRVYSSSKPSVDSTVYIYYREHGYDLYRTMYAIVSHIELEKIRCKQYKR